MPNVLICSNCRIPNPVGSKFCNSCGKGLSETITYISDDIYDPNSVVSDLIYLPESQKHIHSSSKSTELDSNCPVCNKDDQTSRVSAVVQSQTSSSRQYGYSYSSDSSFSISSTGRTALAEKLMKPNPPLHLTVLADFATMFFKWFGGFIGIVFLIIGLLAIGGTPLCGIPLILFGILMLWAAFEKDKPTAEQMKDALEYQRAVRRWEDSFYCFRCDKAFITHNNSKWFISPAGFRQEILYGKFDEE